MIELYYRSLYSLLCIILAFLSLMIRDNRKGYAKNGWTVIFVLWSVMAVINIFIVFIYQMS